MLVRRGSLGTALAAVIALTSACSPADLNSASTAAVTTTSADPPADESTLDDTTTTGATTTSAATTSTLPPITYVFPFAGREVAYSEGHGAYRAVDVFGCGAEVLAPTGGTVAATRTVDLWAGSGNNPAYRGGFYVSLLGDDGVRYYFAHLADVRVAPGQRVAAGQRLGTMGDTGNAAESMCHTHFGISWDCDGTEWAVRRGKVWPQPYLDAWRAGTQTSPTDEVRATQQAEPTACAEALADRHAAEA